MRALADPLDLMALRGNWSEMDYDAVARNYRRVETLVGDGRAIIASVKANAYGHGALNVARRLSACGAYGFATGAVRDAVAIRQAGIASPILVFGGYREAAMPILREHNLTPTVWNEQSLAAVMSDEQGGDVYLKIDAGFGRLGVSLDDAVSVAQAILAGGSAQLRGVYTHVPFTTRRGEEWARKRLNEYQLVVQQLSEIAGEDFITQALDSASLARRFPDTCNAVNPGHLLFGLNPGPDVLDADVEFEQVLRAVKTQLVQVTRYKTSARVGLNGHYSLRQGGIVGVVPFGRGDGYRVSRNADAYMLVNGARAPVIGASLEHSILDVSAVERAAIGDLVTVLGVDGDERIGIEDLALWGTVKPLDVLLGFDGRLPITDRSAAPLALVEVTD